MPPAGIRAMRVPSGWTASQDPSSLATGRNQAGYRAGCPGGEDHVPPVLVRRVEGAPEVDHVDAEPIERPGLGLRHLLDHVVHVDVAPRIPRRSRTRA